MTNRSFALPVKAQSALILGDYKLVKTWKTNQLELFNLSQDVGEDEDLSQKLVQKTREMHDLMVGYLDEVDAETRKTEAEKGRESEEARISADRDIQLARTAATEATSLREIGYQSSLEAEEQVKQRIVSEAKIGVLAASLIAAISGAAILFFARPKDSSSAP